MNTHNPKASMTPPARVNAGKLHGSNFQRTHLRSLLVVLILCLCPAVFAEKIGWDEQMVLRAGDGVDLRNQNQAKARGVVLMGPTAIPDANTGSAFETINFAQHTLDVARSLSVNAQLSVYSSVFGGNFTGGYVGSYKRSANAIDFVFTATRDFGDAYFPITGGFSPDFNSIVANLSRTNSGAALHDAITRTFGSHVVVGTRSSAMVSVIFSFDLGSSSQAQQFSATASGSWSWGEFSAQANSFFSSKDTRRKVSYKFYSSDPEQSPTNFNFSSTGSLTNYDGFTRFISLLESYWWSMNPARAKVTSYILEPIQNVPGYLPLLGGHSPNPILSANYDEFGKIYARLEAWNERLTDWTTDPRRMSWLNAIGQRQALAKRQDVANYFAALKAVAAAHFTNGTPLVVPSDIFNYFYTLSDLPIPTIYVAWASDDTVDTVGSQRHSVIGWIDCGSKSNTLTTPFQSVSLPYHGTNIGMQTPIAYTYHDVTNLVQSQIAYWAAVSGAGPIRTDLQRFLASSEWANLTNAAFSSRRIGFFADDRIGVYRADTSMVISDAAGNIVDQLNWLSTRSGAIPEPMDFGNASISAAPVTTLLAATVGLGESIPLVITNNGLTAAHGVTLEFQLDPNYEFLGSATSQGYAQFDPTSRIVSYTAGPLSPAAQAKVELRVVPLRAGPTLPGANAVLAVGDTLTNLHSAQIDLPQLVSELPVLHSARTSKGIELSWLSDTARLKAVQSPIISPRVSWSAVPNVMVAVSGSKRTMTLPASASHMFYSLAVN